MIKDLKLDLIKQERKRKNLEQLNYDLQHRILEGQNEVKEHINVSGTSEIRGRPRIGDQKNDTNEVYAGNNRWIPQITFDQLMGATKPTMFVNRAADFFFSKKTLLESSVTGQTSHRTKNKNDESLKQLDQNSLLTMSGLFAHYLSHSIFTKSLGPLDRNQEAGKMRQHLSKYIGNLKDKTNNLKTKKQSKEKVNKDIEKDVNVEGDDYEKGGNNESIEDDKSDEEEYEVNEKLKNKYQQLLNDDSGSDDENEEDK
ncbi:uncharacterized protein LOC130673982 [Microplitis mediator]|uniref:uncharacterized protein LOC130673982 n=1 Tax=Microplitis mediator TaxID=375433 RepID=UPI002553D199|nr:uncharacterized protein LOC130673982 [Microplitis mediator]XP_057335211.1 uncharacterized protein LOC130673982 [Microplitis mediator]XP_057335219.1 uncharacterized protein LOC130673982 [Microplitis mediator]XP_057335226.1 uncharacterized protein LOC130673982 [Microplitis mediator]XP_057335233.1 uncharacterized protein LOC130673982 [Microplitis mediator]XP_057335240.1 uncharacterized protein LOC130673982 [Microplitis mediator]